MEFTSCQESIIDSIFGSICSSLKRKRPIVIESNSKVKKEEETKNKVVNKNIDNNKISQTDNIPYIQYFENIVRNLSCVVCQDLCVEAFQCQNGHLLCSNCHSLLIDQRTTVCPICRVPLKDNVTKSLVTEHLIQEMPEICPKCTLVMQKCMIKPHLLYKCPKRLSHCKYKIFGCQWVGTVINIENHEEECHFIHKMANECLSNSETYISKTISAISNDGIILKALLEQMKHQNQSNIITLHKIGLRFINKEVNVDKNKVFTFGNNLFNDGFKIRLRATFSCDSIELNYCLSGNKCITGEYLFFLYELKGNYVHFDIQDNLRNHQFSATETWTNWFKIYLNDSLNELFGIIPNLEGRCIHISMAFITKTTNEKVPIKEGDQWRDLVNDVLSLDSIERQIEQSEAMLNQLGALRGYNASDTLTQNRPSDNLSFESVNTIETNDFQAST